MRKLTFVVVCLTAIVSVTGCKGGGTASANNYAPAIEAVLAQAERAGKEAERTHSFMSTSKTLKKARDAFHSIDLRKCPSDFRVAFLNYITAIENFIPFSEKYDDVSIYSMFVNTTEFFTQGPGRLVDVVEEAKRLKQLLLAAKQKVKEVGLNYNANVNFDF
jgi:hypothetical protein